MLAIAAINGEFDEAYTSDLNISPTCANLTRNLEKMRLAWNYLIVALDDAPLQVVMNTSSRSPFDAWTELLSIYEPSTVEAYSQLLREMVSCNMEDASMASPKVWFYRLDKINRRIGEIDTAYRKTDIQMIVHITSKLPREHYHTLITAYSLSG